MSTGPWHYGEGERLLTESDRCRVMGDDGQPCPICVVTVAKAQAHFTAALAAATALGREGEGRTMASKDRAAWFDVAAECRKAATA